MSLKLYPTSFVAGKETQVFAYDWDHDSDDLSKLNKATLTFTPDGGLPPIDWPVSKIEYVYGYGCSEPHRPHEEGKAVGLLIYTTPPGTTPGCLGGLFGLLLRIFQGRLGGTTPIGSGDLGGSASSDSSPATADFATTPVEVAG